MAKVTRLLVGLFVASCLAAPVLAQKAGIHEDLKRGFRLKIPEKWTTVPVQIDEKWIVAKFLSNRTYETKSRDFTDYGEHKPMLIVIEFSDEARKLRVSEEQRGDTTYVSKNAPFRDYKDYLKRNLSEGYYVDKEVQEDEGGVPCTKFQVKIEKGAQMRRRLTTWVFRAQDGEFAVECDVLEDHYEKLEPMILAALKSFKLIPRSAAPVEAAVTGGKGGDTMWTKDRVQWRKLSLADRQERRKRVEAERMAKMQKDLPPGWVAKRTKHYLVLSHADQKFTNRLVEAAEAYRTWLEASFETVSDEYVMQGIIRICADSDEARAYVKGSSNYDSFNVDDREVVTYQDKGEGNAGLGWGRLYAGMLDQYLYDKDALLYTNLPQWLHTALYMYVSTAKMRGGKLVLEADEWETGEIREAERKNEFLPLKELMGAKAEEREEGKAPKRGYWAQATRWLRYIVGPGQKHPELKNFVVLYMQSTIKAAEELEAGGDRLRDSAKTEEEEEKQAKENKDYWKRRRTEIMARITKEQDWSDATWSSLEKAFHDYMKK